MQVDYTTILRHQGNGASELFLIDISLYKMIEPSQSLPSDTKSSPATLNTCSA